ncbi:MAG: hypothetical protein IJX75_04880 [Clostridia bacterium]|nr:hypothetical protein [Clostridia bacterium]
MDVFYEESAIVHNAKKGEKKYKIFHILSMIFLVVGILFVFPTIMFIPIGGGDAEAKATAVTLFVFFCSQTLLFFGLWFLLYKWKSTINVSYDYCFVTGELRISKVFNVNKRRLITRFNTEEILQIGDIENSSYERLKSDPMTKEVICTSNEEPAEGKFFMYILVNDGGKKLYILECRELMLMNILKFAKRSALENDYVMQEKKQKKV